MSDKKRYAIVGTGSRAGMFVRAITETYRETSELVGFCDLSQVRMDWYNEQLAENFDMASVPTYHADDFDKMVAELNPIRSLLPPLTHITTNILCGRWNWAVMPSAKNR